MSRPLRIEFPGACYHVTARGNGGQAIFTGIEDGRAFLDLLGREVRQQRWLCHGYCLMENHYHVLIETPEANLGRGMGRLNMRYSQWSGRRHARPGHLFQGRYKAILFEKERHLVELGRHVVSNPVRVNAVNRVDQWRWSSYRALATGEDVPDWLAVGDVLGRLADDIGTARAAWRDDVADHAQAPSPWDNLRSGHYLGSETFLRGLKAHIDGRSLDQVPSAMADPARPTAERVLAAVAGAARRPPDELLDRKRAPEPFRATIYLLRRAANLPLREVAAMGTVSPGRVSQIQREIDDAGGLAAAFPWAAGLEGMWD
jgi:REP element-mobilizing transposase RayT